MVITAKKCCCGKVQPTGRCCLPDGTCDEITEVECLNQGGTWQTGGCPFPGCGSCPDTDFANDVCPQALGLSTVAFDTNCSYNITDCDDMPAPAFGLSLLHVPNTLIWRESLASVSPTLLLVCQECDFNQHSICVGGELQCQPIFNNRWRIIITVARRSSNATCDEFDCTTAVPACVSAATYEAAEYSLCPYLGEYLFVSETNMISWPGSVNIG